MFVSKVSKVRGWRGLLGKEEIHVVWWIKRKNQRKKEESVCKEDEKTQN